MMKDFINSFTPLMFVGLWFLVIISPTVWLFMAMQGICWLVQHIRIEVIQ